LHLSGKKQSPQRDGLGKPKGYVSNSQYVVEKVAVSGLPDKIARGETFTVLGIESSCDDTGAAVVRSDGTILSNVVYSQHEIHEKFGGIVPSLAMNAHKDNIDKAVKMALEGAGGWSIDSKRQFLLAVGVLLDTDGFLMKPWSCSITYPFSAPYYITFKLLTMTFLFL